MGALERDNGFTIDPETKIKTFKRSDVSPLAIIDRECPNMMLGGDYGFKNMMDKANE